MYQEVRGAMQPYLGMLLGPTWSAYSDLQGLHLPARTFLMVLMPLYLNRLSREGCHDQHAD